ncbi:UDP-2,4-diacetamido-2,4,6-trideoxy-beta-L-altropyranose hydrolase [Geomobilimonas luticola]|uniref:UDP-2,4-diacetamido-2,4, 6-trideoxy-beta-L-altropyranose hydrolase n=1 Tax=Geomobilimonas luticola TaxID=1114878 RepID=A0ABS5SCL3_9BACT|nr:UDP-2,4-diacetamido-2,4,6-trideoxy-beta-L-altropyranose hydrolase [Geomobilimonas luticola]MBT0653111.1 UDP-2,4-diacetamido-2,4,6-trideoxy-beta-L-altropyranose hydrolase [Geomobilimonas luticola]
MEENHMNVIFRTDASLQIGSGHVMRCLTLAGELKQRGADVMFVCREHPGNLIGLIEGKGYRVELLPQPPADYIATAEDVAHAPLLGVHWNQDAAETVAALDGGQPHWLVVDHYALDRRWEQILRTRVGKIMVIDDLADRHHDCDLLLDQNLYQNMETRYDALVPENCVKLLGPRHALLRPEFTAARRSLRQRDGVIRRVFVFFGGVDPTNETYRALQALAGIADRRFSVDVVVGGGNPHKEQIREFCAAHDGYIYHCQVDNMAELMSVADLAIGAGGSTTWERCSLGLPAIIVALAENQINIAESAHSANALIYIGKAAEVNAEEIAKHITAVLNDAPLIKFLSQRAQQLVEGTGVVLIVNFMGLT